MGPLQKLRYKSRVGLLLALLLLVLVLNNIAGRERFMQIERRAQSIYADRLMPSTYIFELREHLDQEHAALASEHPDAASLRLHREAIAGLMHRYEQTKLTPEERSEWTNFQQHLRQFESIQHEQAGFNEHYAQTLRSLNHLSMIQAGEGRQLRADMQVIANTSELMSWLEIAIILAIGGLTLSLLGISRHIFESGAPHSPSLN